MSGPWPTRDVGWPRDGCDLIRSLCRVSGEIPALRFDPGAIYALTVMPLCSLVWPDEHPGGPMTELPFGADHKACLATIMRLSGARTALWRTGALPENRAVFWNEAQRELPDWPGFHRLA